VFMQDETTRCDRKTKVLFVIDHFYSGGTQRNIKDFTELCDSGTIDARVVSLFGGDAFFNPSDPLKSKKINLLNGRFTFFRYFLCFFYLVLKLTHYLFRERFDVVHIRLFASLPVGVIAAKIAGVKNILFTIEASEKQLPWYSFSVFKLFSGFMCYIFSYYRKEYISAGLPEKKFLPYIGGIRLLDVRKTKLNRKALLKTFSMEVDYPIILSVGRLHFDKGHQYAISALKYLKPVYPMIKLVILGEGQYRDELERQICKLGLEENVWLAGFYNNISEFLYLADLYIKAALNEPTNLATMQAMACGNPVVAFDAQFDEEIIDHLKTGFLVKQIGARFLADGIRIVLEDDELRNQIAENGRHLVVNSYDISKAVRYMENIYRECTFRV